MQVERIVARTVPQARISLDPARAGIDAAALGARLAAGDPSIRLGRAGDALVFNPHMMGEGEAEQVAGRLRAVLEAVPVSA